MKISFVKLWIISLWRLLKNNIRTIYFNSKQYNQSLKATPASRNYDIHNVHILGELQDKNTKNYILAKQFKKNLWKINNLKQERINNLHKFSWLPHLDIKKDKELAKIIIDAWLEKNNHYQSTTWDLLVLANRIIFWITSPSLTIRHDDLIYRTKITNSILKQCVHLSKNITHLHSKKDRIYALFSLILAGTTFEGYKKFTDSSIKILNNQLKNILDKKGFVETKNIQDQFWILHHLILIKESLYLAQYPIPEFLDERIEQLGKLYASLLYANDTIPLFNGAKYYDCSNFNQFIKSKGYKFVKDNNESHFLFGKIKKLEAIMDTNNPPSDFYSQDYQAGCLSFEMMYGGTKIITNCGYAHNFSKELAYLSQSTAAHSCLTINDTSSCIFQKNPLIKQYHGNSLLKKLKVYKREFSNDKISFSLSSAHDGYQEKYGTLFERTIVGNEEQKLLHGEDTLIVSKNDYAFLNFSIRFHVMPEAKLIQTHGGDVLISIENQGWKFRSPGQTINIDNSLYFADTEKVQETKCIVIEGTLNKEINKILWSLEKSN